ncbi:hypothetical protein [Aeoliella sp. SH292]|uniref:hypothetical protein n=1 Tax=Aeoliella sp. SH292 TaxID=3454464 RepID=UPI003F9DE878
MSQADPPITDNLSIPGQVDDASRAFVGKWHTLVSTTNWEKGRIIGEWRAAKQAAGEEVSEYSDEAWAAMVGEVTSQHVGRLRRVFDRFGEVYDGYAGLYWSHFHAALDWEDAELWLEGALQKGWSISQMRKARDKAHGKSDDDTNVSTSIMTKAEHDAANGVELAAVADPDDDEYPETDSPERSESDSESSEYSELDEMPAAPKSTAPKTRPFESLKELPDDLADAFEAMKLAILAHKLSKWDEVSREDVVASLEALKALAMAPSE